MRLEQCRWPELGDVGGKIFVVPLGSLEQHGHHLPLVTDTLIISRIAEHVEAERGASVVTLPTQWLGHSPHHRGFGCVSLDLLPYVEMIRGMCRSLIALGARRIFLLNGHGGNDIPCKAAMREMKSEFEAIADLYIVYAAYWNLAAAEFTAIRQSPEGGMGHACEMETSILLAAQPELVDRAKIARGGPGSECGFGPLDMLKGAPHFMIYEFDEVSSTGAIGMPEFATAEKGERFLAAAGQAVVRFIDQFATWKYPERRRVS